MNTELELLFDAIEWLKHVEAELNYAEDSIGVLTDPSVGISIVASLRADVANNITRLERQAYALFPPEEPQAVEAEDVDHTDSVL